MDIEARFGPNRTLAGWCGGVLFALFLLPLAHAADTEVAQLRNDIRSLEREVRELSRRVDQLQQSRAAPAPAAGSRLSTAPDPAPTAWIAPEKWDRIRTGMTAQDVIVVLGAPVSMRSEGDPVTQTLFYTLPMGEGGFLTGTVRFRNNQVMDVQKPVLK